VTDLKKMIQKCDEVSSVMKSLSHPVRLKILCQLVDREMTVGELTEFCDISQSAMSQFLIRMLFATLVLLIMNHVMI
jgi:DNA-binding transcriptional ArsR family regulator